MPRHGGDVHVPRRSGPPSRPGSPVGEFTSSEFSSQLAAARQATQHYLHAKSVASPMSARYHHSSAWPYGVASAVYRSPEVYSPWSGNEGASPSGSPSAVRAPESPGRGAPGRRACSPMLRPGAMTSRGPRTPELFYPHSGDWSDGVKRAFPRCSSLYFSEANVRPSGRARPVTPDALYPRPTHEEVRRQLPGAFGSSSLFLSLSHCHSLQHVQRHDHSMNRFCVSQLSARSPVPIGAVLGAASWHRQWGLPPLPT